MSPRAYSHYPWLAGEGTSKLIDLGATPRTGNVLVSTSAHRTYERTWNGTALPAQLALAPGHHDGALSEGFVIIATTGEPEPSLGGTEAYVSSCAAVGIDVAATGTTYVFIDSPDLYLRYRGADKLEVGTTVRWQRNGLHVGHIVRVVDGAPPAFEVKPVPRYGYRDGVPVPSPVEPDVVVPQAEVQASPVPLASGYCMKPKPQVRQTVIPLQAP